MGKPTPFGLGATATNGQVLFLPLQSVFVEANILDVSALVQLEQQYVNPFGNGHLSSAQYVFPISGNAAVCAFKMEDSDGRVVTGVVKEREEAKQDFEEAVREGKWAGVAYEITADVFCISIGAMPPGLNVKITLSYSLEIPENESEIMNQIRFALPTFIGQRYGHAPAELSQPRSDDSAATFNFKANVKLTSNILRITSPSHPSVLVVQPTQRLHRGSAPLYATQVDLLVPAKLDRDFVLSIQAEKLDMPRCFAEINKAKNTTALLLTLVPRLGAPDVTSQEYIFVVDRSGSMAGEGRIEYAKDTLKHLIAGLPPSNTYFNIISFGSHYTPMWKQSVAYIPNQATAIATVEAMAANMRGTEIRNALEWTFRSRMRGTHTAVIVLTDGQVSQPERVIESVRQMVQASEQGEFFRVFSIGIGNGASEALCSGIARAGNGVCFMTTQNEEIKSRCSKILRAARATPYGSASNLRVDWGYDTVPLAPPPPHSTRARPEKKKKPTNFFDRRINPFENMSTRFVLPPPPDVLQAPTQVPNFYPGNRFTVAAILANTVVAPAQVVLHGTLPGGEPVEIPVNVAYVSADAERPPVLHTLAARRFIRELEDGDISALGISDEGDADLHDEIVKAAVVDYGTRYSLASRFTSFVAIEEGEDQSDDEDEASLDSDEYDSDGSVETKTDNVTMDPKDDPKDDMDDMKGNQHGAHDGMQDKQHARGYNRNAQTSTAPDDKAGAQNHSQRGSGNINADIKTSPKDDATDRKANDHGRGGNNGLDNTFEDNTKNGQSATVNNTTSTMNGKAGTRSDNAGEGGLQKAATGNRHGKLMQLASSINQQDLRSKWLEPHRVLTSGLLEAETNDVRETPRSGYVYEEKEIFEDASCPCAVKTESHALQPFAPRSYSGQEIGTRNYEIVRLHATSSKVEVIEFVEGILPSPPRGWYNIQIPKACDRALTPPLIVESIPKKRRISRESLEVEGLPAWLVPTPISHVTKLERAAPSPPVQSAPSQSFTPAVVVVAADPVTAVSDIQSGDGSFSLDRQLLRLLQQKKRSLSLTALKSSIPSNIRDAGNAEKVWGTVLAVAYMLVALPESRSIWDSLWDKARDFVCQEANISSYEFNQLVQAASAQLQ